MATNQPTPLLVINDGHEYHLPQITHAVHGTRRPLVETGNSSTAVWPRAVPAVRSRQAPEHYSGPWAALSSLPFWPTVAGPSLSATSPSDIQLYPPTHPLHRATLPLPCCASLSSHLLDLTLRDNGNISRAGHCVPVIRTAGPGSRILSHIQSRPWSLRTRPTSSCSKKSTLLTFTIAPQTTLPE